MNAEIIATHLHAKPTMLAAALDYARRGWHVFPCRPRRKKPLTEHGHKDATTDEATIRRWWQTWPNANIGIACDKSGLAVIDVDGRHNGHDDWSDLVLRLGLDDETLRARSGSGDGLHLYYRKPEGITIRSSAGKLGNGVDVKTNGYVVAPPSVHPFGGRYAWEPGFSPDDLEPKPLPEALVSLLAEPQEQSQQGGESPQTTDTRIPEGRRNDTLFRLGCAMRRRGATPENIETMLLLENVARCDPPLPEDEVLRIAKSAAGYDPAPDNSATVMTRFVPRAFTERILAQHTFYACGEKRTGDFWHYDADAGLWRDDAEPYLVHLLRKDGLLPTEWQREFYVSEIIADVRALSWHSEPLPEPPLPLIPFANGVFDLDTGALRPYRPVDGFTAKLPWDYDPQATSKVLERRLAAFPEHIQQHSWELLAYCLWRGYPFQRAFFWTGRGSNGKSYLATLLTWALGADNVSQVPLHRLTEDKFAAAALHRRLLNVSGELAYQDLERTELLKSLTGGDFITADRKYREPIKFRNYAKLLFLGNALPTSRDTTDAFFRRAFVVEFDCVFAEDPRVEAELELLTPEERRREFSCLLTRAVETLRRLRADGFAFSGDLPLEERRKRYLSLSDPLRQFIAECCEVTRSADDYVYKFEFAERLNEWLRERGLNEYSDKRLGQAMKALGFEDGQRGEKRWWAWVGLRLTHAIHRIHTFSQTDIKAPLDGFKHPVNPVNPVSNIVGEPLGGLSPTEPPCPQCGQPLRREDAADEGYPGWVRVVCGCGPKATRYVKEEV